MGTKIDALDRMAPHVAVVRRMAFRHNVPVDEILDLLDLTATNQPGKQAQPTILDRLDRLDRTLGLTSSAYWIERVRLASGKEALFDQQFRFLAVSPKGRLIRCAQGHETELPEKAFLGAKCASFLPPATSLLADGQHGLDGLRTMGLFNGGLRGVQLNLEMNFGYYVQNCIMAFWPVQTRDRGILAHSQIHDIDRLGGGAKQSGVTVHSVLAY